ncbi:hypothetical protein DFH09DRAFT_1093447 [Mycena vulgaris]|nr:hypothetical protein DFH09DRAFT_1093447 [Mycena vulgaris]
MTADRSSRREMECGGRHERSWEKERSVPPSKYNTKHRPMISASADHPTYSTPKSRLDVGRQRTKGSKIGENTCERSRPTNGTNVNIQVLVTKVYQDKVRKAACVIGIGPGKEGPENLTRVAGTVWEKHLVRFREVGGVREFFDPQLLGEVRGTGMGHKKPKYQSNEVRKPHAVQRPEIVSKGLIHTTRSRDLSGDR